MGGDCMNESSAFAAGSVAVMGGMGAALALVQVDDVAGSAAADSTARAVVFVAVFVAVIGGSFSGVISIGISALSRCSGVQL